MKVSEDAILDALSKYYRHSSGQFNMEPNFIEYRYAKVKELLESLDGHGFSNLDILRLAALAVELQIIKDSTGE